MRIRRSSLYLSIILKAVHVHITCTQHGYTGSSIPVEDDAFPLQTIFALAITAGPRSNTIKLKQMYVELMEQSSS